MTPSEMEQEIKTLNARTEAIGQILPTLATRQDLRDEIAKLATKDELREQVAKLATKDELREAVARLATKDELQAGVEEAKLHAVILWERVRDDVRLLAEQMATKADVQELRREMRGMGDDVRLIAEQVANLSADRRPKKRRT